MTIQVDSRITEAVETDGVSKRFDFNFPLFKGDDDQGLEVRFVNELGYDVVDREDYSLVVGLENKGGHVLFHVAPEAGLSLVIAGKTPLDQSLDITNPGKFFAQSVERSLDKITSMIQEFVSTLDEETRQRINNDNDLRERLDTRFTELAASIDQRFQGKWTEMSDYLNSLLPMFFCIMRKEIDKYARTGLIDVIDSRIAEIIDDVRNDAQFAIDNLIDELHDAINTINQDNSIPAIAVIDGDKNQRQINQQNEQSISNLTADVAESITYVDAAVAENKQYVDSAVAGNKQYTDQALSAFSGPATKFFPTVAAANAAIGTIGTGEAVWVGDAANGGLYEKKTADATSLTKSAYDPTTQLSNNVPKYDQSPVASQAGVRFDRYVSAQAFKQALDFLMLPYKTQLSALTQEIVKVKAQLSDLELSTLENSAKLDAFRLGFVKADYYLAADGNDSNAGTIAAPFRSFAPILAMSAGALNSKIIALKSGDSFSPMDLAFLNANNCQITSYGNTGLGRPFIDCTAAITETWTEHAAGVWKVTLTHNGDSKTYPNFFKNGVPVQKVISVAALATASANAVYAENQTANTFTAYMKSSINPSTDGNTYRWSKYASAITLIGTGSTIDNIYSLGNAHQDGALVVKTADASGGCNLSRCRVDWGNRHSALVGSGTRTSIAEFNEFYGGADDVETGNVLNAGGGANAIVFNSADHQTATCIDRYNVYDGLTRPNYNAPASLTYFTGGYGHDAVETRPMLKYISYGNTYKNVDLCHSSCAVTGTFDDCTFDNVTQLISADDVNTNYTISNSSGNLEQFARGANLNITLNWINNDIVVKDLARGNPGFVRYAEGTGAIYLNISGGSIDVQGSRASASAANKTLFRVKNGTLAVNGLTVYPKLGTPFTYLIDVIAGGAFSILSSNNNTYPIGALFRNAGTEYNLSAWVAAGFDGANSKRHDMPNSTLADNFTRTDALLTDDVYVQKGGVTTALAIRSNKLATLNGSTQAAALGSVDSQNLWCRKVTESTVGSSGIALLVENDTNFIIVRETSTQYQLQVCNAGAFSTLNGVGVTPAIGQEVIALIKNVTDPETKVTVKRAWLIADNRNVLNAQTITMPTAMTNTKTVGFVGRGAANPLLSNASWGVLT